MLSVAALAEILAYYVPGVDNLLDTLATPAALAAGTIVSAAVMTDVPPMVKWTAAVIAGDRWPHARRDHTTQGQIHLVDGRSRQRGHCDCGTWRRAASLAFGAGGAARRTWSGYIVLMAGSTSTPAAVFRSAPSNSQKWVLAASELREVSAERREHFDERLKPC